MRQRLLHLGFWQHTPGTNEESRAVQDTEAIKSFQRVKGLTITGLVDEATKAAILKAHGI